MDPNNTPPTNPNNESAPVAEPEPDTSVPVTINTEPKAPAEPEAPVAAPAPVTSDATPVAPVAVASGNKQSKKAALVAVLAVVVLGLGSAAAYAGFVVPNKPQNLLKAAINNSLSSKGGQFTGTVSVKPKAGAGAAVKVDLSGGANYSAKTAAFKADVDFSGVTLPVETRLVSGNLYFKLGDLSQVAGLAQTFSPSAGTLVKQLSGQVSNKWFEVDSTALDSAGVGCFTSSSWAFSKADAQLIESNYKAHPFTTISSTSSDTVGGKKVEKMVLSIDDDKLSTYLKNLKFNQLSLFKRLQDCNKALVAKNDYKEVGDHAKNTLTVWIDKGSKQIVQVSGGSKAGSSVNTTVTITLNHTLPTINAPAGAANFTQLTASLSSALGGLGFDPTSLFSGLNVGGTQTEADNAKRASDIQTLQTYMEAFFSENNYYPSLTDMNNASWRKANMPYLDSNALQDPSGSSQTLSATPGKGVFAYQVTTDGGNSCESSDTTCTRYTLTATFDGQFNGQSTYTKTSLN